MPGPLFLRNDTISLHSVSEEDYSFLKRYHQHPEIRASRSVQYPADDEWARRHLDGIMGRNDETLALIICADSSPIGVVYLIREQPDAQVYRYGELAYWIVPSEWGNGYATAAGRLILRYAFEEIGLHRVEASAFVSNEASKRVLEKLGFVAEGTKRKVALVNGDWEDKTWYGLLQDEWERC